MKNTVKKTLDEILNKKFSKNYTIGYDPLQVDMFFDQIRSFIVEQYKQNLEYDKIIKDKEKKINSLIKEKESLEKSILMLNSEIDSYKEDGYQSQKVIKEISEIKKQISEMKDPKKG